MIKLQKTVDLMVPYIAIMTAIDDSSIWNRTIQISNQWFQLVGIIWSFQILSKILLILFKYIHLFTYRWLECWIWILFHDGGWSTKEKNIHWQSQWFLGYIPIWWCWFGLGKIRAESGFFRRVENYSLYLINLNFFRNILETEKDLIQKMTKKTSVNWLQKWAPCYVPRENCLQLPWLQISED